MLHGYLDLPTFTFFHEKNIWTGSVFQNFNYRIMLKTNDDAIELYGVIWEGMKCFDLVDSSEYIEEFHEEFSAEGLEAMIEKLNDRVEKFKSNGGHF